MDFFFTVYEEHFPVPGSPPFLIVFTLLIDNSFHTLPTFFHTVNPSKQAKLAAKTSMFNGDFVHISVFYIFP